MKKIDVLTFRCLRLLAVLFVMLLGSTGAWATELNVTYTFEVKEMSSYYELTIKSSTGKSKSYKITSSWVYDDPKEFGENDFTISFRPYGGELSFKQESGSKYYLYNSSGSFVRLMMEVKSSNYKIRNVTAKYNGSTIYSGKNIFDNANALVSKNKGLDEINVVLSDEYNKVEEKTDGVTVITEPDFTSESITEYYQAGKTIELGYTGEVAAGYHVTYTAGDVNYNPFEVTDNHFIMPNKDAYVRASVEANTYTVVFNANDGSGYMANQSFTYDKGQKLSCYAFSAPEGYIFYGWSTTADGDVKYTNQQNVSNLTTENNGTVTLFAKWGEIDVPYTENFDYGFDGNIGWKTYDGQFSEGMNGSSLVANEKGWLIYGGSINNVLNYKHVYLANYGTNLFKWFISPLFAIQDNCMLSFQLALTNAIGDCQPHEGDAEDDKFAVLVSTDNGATWHSLRIWANDSDSEYKYNDITNEEGGEGVEIDLREYSGKSIRIAFYGESLKNEGDYYSKNNIHVGRISLGYIPCDEPTGLSVNSVSDHGLQFSFTPKSEYQGKWYYAWTTENEAPETFIGSTETTTVTVENQPSLLVDTHYYLWTAYLCPNDNTYHVSESVEFTTTNSLKTIDTENISIDDVQAHEITLSWVDDNTDNVEWEVYYSTSSELPDDESTIQEVAITTTKPTITISGLRGYTDYYFWIRSRCNWYGAEQWSNWSNSFTACTLVSCPAPTNLAASCFPDGVKITWTGQPWQENWKVIIKSDDTGDESQPIDVIGESCITLGSESFYEVCDGDDYFEKLYTVVVYPKCDEADGTTQTATLNFFFTDKNILTVNDGTETNPVVPIYAFHVDTKVITSQFIIPQKQLKAMNYSEIYKMIFYGNWKTIDWKDATFDVYMTTTNATKFTSTDLSWDEFGDPIYSGPLSVDNYKMTVGFSDATIFEYETGNLLIGFKINQNGSSDPLSWFGVSTEGNTAVGGYPNEMEFFNFLPKITFTYIPYAHSVPTGINEVLSQGEKQGDEALSSDQWYLLDGRKLSGKPTKKGMYIHNGKKILR